MMIYEVTKLQQKAIKMMFGNFVFNREQDGIYYVKVSAGQRNLISKIGIILTNGKPESA